MNPNAPLPDPAAPAAHSAEPGAAPLTAAQDAADFVARIFAPSPPEGADLAPAPAAAAAPQAQDRPAWPPAPVDWPGSAQPLAGQRVLVLGLGASGLAMARWCTRLGAQVTVADTRSAPPQAAALHAELPAATLVTGALEGALVPGMHAIYRSPGLSPAVIAPILEAAGAYQVRVSGEIDLFSAALAHLRAQHGYAPAVLAITGTNGKTTVACLTAQLVRHAAGSVALAGNIGPTLLDTLTACLAAQDLPAVWVLELSSFQLEDAHDFEPTAAVVLNLTQDHLDWHASMAAYAAAKARIFGQQALMVLNRDDDAVCAMLPAPVKVKLQKPRTRAHLSFGADLPQRPGDFGLESTHGMTWLVRALEADETQRGARGQAQGGGALHLQRLMPADALRIRGRHNACNALAALALAQAAGYPLGAMLYGLREYRGEPHRVESVGVVAGVEYFDDSKGTNVGATVAALTGLGVERRLVVILGGDGKGQDFTPLAAPLACYARAVVLIGRDAPQIAAALRGVAAEVPLQHAATLPDAVAQAAALARPGDAVLLSPACASLDMFRDYAHRAQVFVEAVQDWAQAQGQDLEGRW